MSRAALPMRLARREVMRRPGRTALVALLVALPVAAMAMAVVLIRSDFQGPDAQWVRYNGQADLRTQQDLEALSIDLPEGSREVVISGSFLEATSDDVVGADEDGPRGRTTLEVTDTPLLDPITAGMFTLLDGRTPTRAGEIVLSPHVLDDLRAEVGDVLEPRWLSTPLEIVGTVEQPTCLDCNTAIVAHGSLTGDDGWVDNGRRVLVDLPEGVPEADLQALVLDGDGMVAVRTIAPVDDLDDGTSGVRWAYVLGAVALTVAGIVISAAFAVGARRQLVTIGQLAASGASPATIRAALVLQGTLTGVVGAALGLVIAAGVLAVGEGRVEVILGHRLDGYVVRPLELLAVVVIGVAAATIAALLPARTAARIPTLAALAGRRPIAAVPRRLVAGGFAAVAAGLALLGLAVLGSTGGGSGDVWALVAVVGGVLELLGACAIAPAIVARLEPLASRARGSWRLAARSLSRHRSRTGAVVSAVAAAGALAVTATALVLGADARDAGYLGSPDDVIVAREVTEVAVVSDDESYIDWRREDAPVSDGVRTELELIAPGARITDLRTASTDVHDPEVAQGGGGFQIDAVNIDGPEGAGDWLQYGYSLTEAIVADDELLDAIRASDEVRDGLAEHGIVVLDRQASGDVVLAAPGGVELPGVVAVNRYRAGYLSEVLMTEAAAAAAGLDVRVTGTLVHAAEPLDTDQREALEELDDEVGFMPPTSSPDASSTYVDLMWHSPSSGPSAFQLELLLSGVALVLALFVVGVSLALAAAESKDERDVLTIAGAPPRTLARAAGARAGLLAGIGAAMAVPVGFLPVVVFTQAESEGYPLVFPVRTVVLLLVAVPAIVAVVAFGSSSTAQRLRPVRVSTATFE